MVFEGCCDTVNKCCARHVLRDIEEMNSKKFDHLLAVGFVTGVICSCAAHKPIIPEPVVVEHHVVSSPGENLTALTRVTETEYKCDYPFGGDKGKNLFFTQRDNADYTNIFKKQDPISASMSQKTSGRNHNMAPSYCEATDMVAFEGRLEGNTVSDLYMVNASQTNALTQVTNTPDAHESFPCLNRDGKKIVYEKRARHANMKESEIWIKNLQTNENIMLGMGRMPSFSHDGKSIVYVKYASDGMSTSLCTINADGTNQVQLTDASMGTIWRPCFSPDDRHIVFQCAKQQKSDFDLYVVDYNGNGLIQLTINNSYDGEPYWANDGNIYFTSDRGGRDGHYQIWRFKFGQSTAPILTTTHVVARGENINQIAQKYNVTVRDIVKWNNLSTMTLTPGMHLKISAQ